MKPDLSTVIRDALHADEIAAADLRQPELRASSARRMSRFLAPAAAAAVVVIIAVVVAMMASDPGDGHHTASGSATFEAAIGYRWRVVQLRDAQGTVSVPSSLHAEIAFTHDGYVLGNDTVNGLQGTYRRTDHGYVVRNVIVGAVGSTGGNSLQMRTMNAVDAMFSTASPNQNAAPSATVVRVSVDGGALTLRQSGTILTLRRSGPQPKFSASVPSATSTSSTPSG